MRIASLPPQAIREQVQQIIDVAGQAGVKVLCLQEAWWVGGLVGGWDVGSPAWGVKRATGLPLAGCWQKRLGGAVWSTEGWHWRAVWATCAVRAPCHAPGGRAALGEVACWHDHQQGLLRDGTYAPGHLSLLEIWGLPKRLIVFMRSQHYYVRYIT